MPTTHDVAKEITRYQALDLKLIGNEPQAIFLENCLEKRFPASPRRFEMIILNEQSIEALAGISRSQAYELTDSELDCVAGGSVYTIMPVPSPGVIKPEPICTLPFPDVPPPSDIRGPFVS